MIPFCILVIEDDDDREFMAALLSNISGFFTKRSMTSEEPMEYGRCSAGHIGQADR